MSASSPTRAPERPAAHERFDRRLAEILDYATEIFADKGYEGASMRDLSRLSGISLAGLYYYFDCKEKLLYFIQHHTFTTLIERVREHLASSTNPEERIRIFVRNHIDYAVARQQAMKVLSHEDDVLKNGYGAELTAIKREYYRICVRLVDDLAKAGGTEDARARVCRARWHQHAQRRDGTVRDDELALHLVQPAGRSRRRGPGPRDQRHFPARRAGRKARRWEVAEREQSKRA